MRFKVLLLLAVLSVGCSDNNDTVTVSEVTLDKTELELPVGVTGQLTATVKPDDAEDKTVTWSSDDTAIATVNENGLVTAISLGNAVITAEAGGKTATCAVTVQYLIETVFIPAGTFMMGSPENEPRRQTKETQHPVTLTQGFYMGKYEITNAQYAVFLNASGIGEAGRATVSYDGTSSEELLVRISAGNYNWGLEWRTDGWAPVTGYENHPVIFVSWYGAKAYADWAGGSLPTEAQWEYACRGGQTESLPFGIGNGKDLTGDMANFNGRYVYIYADGGFTDLGEGGGPYAASTTAAGTYANSYANGFQLCDMHGNVWEWCLDSWTGANYVTGSDHVTDPVSPDPGIFRVYRGGSWFLQGQYCRSAYRSGEFPDFVDSSIGFRVVFML